MTLPPRRAQHNADAPHSPFYCPDQILQQDAVIVLPEQAAHHARIVMRLRDGDVLKLFNPQSGEWQGTVQLPDKKTVSVTLTEHLPTQENLRDVWLVLAPLKNKDAFDNAVRHAVELGITRLVLVQTERTQQAKINAERLHQQMTDAAQQCGRLSVPDLDLPQPLKKILTDWPPDRMLFACVEGETASSHLSVAAKAPDLARPLALLIGPEGGFSDTEKQLLTQATPDWLKPVSLGSLILRSDTAVAAGLSLCLCD